jgi:indole-3-glycerol phosphate synthase
MSDKLDEILRAKEAEVTAAKKARSIGDLKRMILDTPPLRSFRNALGGKFGIIAEVKRCSPSMGNMRLENFEQAPEAYAKSSIVKAISVITDSASFGMSHDHLLQVKAVASQPVLKKDFIESDYGVYQARAFGADAVLLMASVLKTRDKGQRLFDLAGELGLDVLYEAHTKEEIDRIPDGVQIYGINSRNFMGQWKRASLAKAFQRLLPLPDFSSDWTVFSIIKYLPSTAIKVAESGISATRVSDLITLGYNAALIGTSLLKAPAGIQNALSQFEEAIMPSREGFSSRPQPVHA